MVLFRPENFVRPTGFWSDRFFWSDRPHIHVIQKGSLCYKSHKSRGAWRSKCIARIIYSRHEKGGARGKWCSSRRVRPHLDRALRTNLDKWALRSSCERAFAATVVTSGAAHRPHGHPPSELETVIFPARETSQQNVQKASCTCGGVCIARRRRRHHHAPRSRPR